MCLNINSNYNESCVDNRIKDKVIVIDNINPTIEYGQPFTDDGKYSDVSGKVTINEEHQAYYIVTIKDIFNMHAKLDLIKMIYNLDALGFEMSRESDTLSNKYIITLKCSFVNLCTNIFYPSHKYVCNL